MGTNRRFQAGDRIIFEREYIGTLLDEVEPGKWAVEWEDGADTTKSTFPASRMIHVNGGPASAAAGMARTKAAALREAVQQIMAHEQKIPGLAESDYNTGLSDTATWDEVAQWLTGMANTIDPHTERKDQ